ncbi:MetQ/NlpA family ABC transporter substrate-binding protein [Bradyrhizobium sp. SZCCHNPS2010]|uniref:MetQ/NlpA family ABC transporter substrate-binding protein n=1 Tax=Bradyrhizobium sp. SZCCHNPS2010 TaxID=3057333 RepID=UPI002916A0C8|nr:MetQ/NlpA family ABC transporter substrate-binding protein [Bradyrhizobium sp. SZCCHNPS2010]
MQRILLSILAGLALFAASAFADQKIKVGISSGDAEILWTKVKEIAAKDGLDVSVVVFNDYLLPDVALDSGDLDTNAFQHRPFLDNQIKTRGYKIVPVGTTIIAPIGLYSKKVESVDEIRQGAAIGIPNDPSNGGRALLLLQVQKLIKVKEGVGLLPTLLDMVDNPRKLQFREIDAAQLPRSLGDLDVAVVDTNYAVPAGLIPSKDSIAIESPADDPYSNFIAVRERDKDAPRVPTLVRAFQSETIRQLIKDRLPGQIPAF